jgi:hypothetical protein
MPHPRATAAILVAVALTVPDLSRAQAPASGGSTGPAAPTGPVAAAAVDPLRALLAQVDEVWLVRDTPGKMDQVNALLEKARPLAPDDYGVLWRTARYYYWQADDPAIADAEKARLGKLAWEWADRANLANPNAVEGWFYGSAGVGMYAVGISIVKALFDGMESKYLDRLKRSQSIDPMFYGDGADVSWGRYYYELPWPKYDGEKSEQFLRKALRAFPKNLRARVYLAELYFKEDHPAEATKLIDAVLAATPGEYDAPEERRAQAMARAVQAKNR